MFEETPFRVGKKVALLCGGEGLLPVVIRIFSDTTVSPVRTAAGFKYYTVAKRRAGKVRRLIFINI